MVLLLYFLLWKELLHEDAGEATGRGGTVNVTTRHANLGRELLSRAVIGADVEEGEFCILEVHG